MIRREGGDLVAECDECGETREAETDDFHDFVEELKDAGWRIRKEDGEWKHRCPDVACDPE